MFFVWRKVAIQLYCVSNEIQRLRNENHLHRVPISEWILFIAKIRKMMELTREGTQQISIYYYLINKWSMAVTEHLRLEIIQPYKLNSFTRTYSRNFFFDALLGLHLQWFMELSSTFSCPRNANLDRARCAKKQLHLMHWMHHIYVFTWILMRIYDFHFFQL